MLSKIQRCAIQTTSLRAFSKHLNAFATIDPNNMDGSDKGFNLVDGKWQGTEKYIDLPDPMTGKTLCKCPDTQLHEIDPFI